MVAPFISNQKKPEPYNSSQGASFRSKPLMIVLPRPRPLDSPLPVFWTFLFPFPLFQANSTLTNKANHFFKRSSMLSYLTALLAQCSLIYTIKIYNSKFSQLMKAILVPVRTLILFCLLPVVWYERLHLGGSNEICRAAVPLPTTTRPSLSSSETTEAPPFLSSPSHRPPALRPLLPTP